MQNEKISNNKMPINYEKIGVYVACIGLLFLFWQSQMSISDKIADIRERIAKLEIKIEKLEDK